MAEYIEREGLKYDLRNWIVDYEVNGEHETADCLRECIDLIDDTPTADVVPVRTELRKAVDLLHKNYEKALNSPYVRDPIAWTLYHTWKEMNGGADNG